MLATGSSRGFSTESSRRAPSYPPCLSYISTGGGPGAGAGIEEGGSVERRESMALRRSFEKGDGRFFGDASVVERVTASQTTGREKRKEESENSRHRLI